MVLHVVKEKPEGHQYQKRKKKTTTQQRQQNFQISH